MLLLLLQVGFFEIVVLPLVKAFVELIPTARPLLNSVNANYGMWSRQLQASQAAVKA